jgi:hypothetical protein
VETRIRQKEPHWTRNAYLYNLNFVVSDFACVEFERALITTSPNELDTHARLLGALYGNPF